MPDQKQLDLEKFTAEKIVQLCGELVIFTGHGDATKREPDTLFSGQQLLGIEVTTAYYHGDEDDPNLHARGLEIRPNPKFDEHGVRRLIDPKTGKPKIWDRMDERLTTSCQRALNEKCSKRYAGVDHLWLGIYADAPVTESHEFDSIVKQLAIPNINPFQ